MRIKQAIAWVGLALMVPVVSVLMGTGTPVVYAVGDPGMVVPLVGNECTRWAHELGQADVHDSPVMHEVGCDETLPGVYERIEGACAIDARRVYRSGLMPGTVEFRVAVANGATRCVFIADDGSWVKE